MNQPIQFNIFNSTPTLYWLHRCVVSPVVVCHVNQTLGPVTPSLLLTGQCAWMRRHLAPYGLRFGLHVCHAPVYMSTVGVLAHGRALTTICLSSCSLEYWNLFCLIVGQWGLVWLILVWQHICTYVSSRGDVTMCLTGDCRDGSGQGPPSTSAMTFMRNSLRSQVRKHRQCDRLAIVSCSP